jgi:hypothetical protein
MVEALSIEKSYLSITLYEDRIALELFLHGKDLYEGNEDLNYARHELINSKKILYTLLFINIRFKLMDNPNLLEKLYNKYNYRIDRFMHDLLK